ncbi:MAG: hypothetical protein Q9166_006356 [cf. Caloplaca sp. 2 TL-2023]
MPSKHMQDAIPISKSSASTSSSKHNSLTLEQALAYAEESRNNTSTTAPDLVHDDVLANDDNQDERINSLSYKEYFSPGWRDRVSKGLSENQSENTRPTRAVRTLRSWIEELSNPPKRGDQSITREYGKQFRNCFLIHIRGANAETFIEILKMYSNTEVAQRDPNLILAILHSLRMESMMLMVWKKQAFVDMVHDRETGPILTKLFNYALVARECVVDLMNVVNAAVAT